MTPLALLPLAALLVSVRSLVSQASKRSLRQAVPRGRVRAATGPGATSSAETLGVRAARAREGRAARRGRAPLSSGAPATPRLARGSLGARDAALRSRIVSLSQGRVRPHRDGTPADAQALALRALCDARLGAREEALADLLRVRQDGDHEPGGGRPWSTSRRRCCSIAAVIPTPPSKSCGSSPSTADDRPAVIEAFGLVLLRLPLTARGDPRGQARDDPAGRSRRVPPGPARRSELGRMALEELVSRYPYGA